MMDLLQKIGDAKVELEQAKHATLDARSREVAALNNLNKLQHEFDETVREFREASPADSDWGVEGRNERIKHG